MSQEEGSHHYWLLRTLFWFHTIIQAKDGDSYSSLKPVTRCTVHNGPSHFKMVHPELIQVRLCSPNCQSIEVSPLLLLLLHYLLHSLLQSNREMVYFWVVGEDLGQHNQTITNLCRGEGIRRKMKI